MKITTAEQMRDIDRRASEEYGLPSLVLMENAGREVASVVQNLRRARGNESGYYSVTVVAGLSAGAPIGTSASHAGTGSRLPFASTGSSSW